MKKNKNIFFYILSFLIPLLSLLLIFLLKEFLTDKHSLLISDAYYQYYELLFYFKRIIQGSSNLFYTFSLGFGNSFLSSFAYYLISPFNLITLFFSEENMHLAFLTIVILKLSLCGLTMFTYLKYHFKNNNFMLLAFSTAYALSSYNIGNYFQIMWLDDVIIAPLVLLGIDKIINSDKSLLYGLTLFLAVLLNYYIGYMICIFSIVYFIYRLLEKYNIKKEYYLYKNKIFSFIIISILAGLMTMFLNYSNLLNIMTINRGNGSFFIKETTTLNLNILKNISQLYIVTVSNKQILNKNFIYLYCGVAIIPLIYFYFLNKRINKKEKLLTSIIFLILLINSIFNPLNNFWHALSTPIGFNYRYAFLFIIFALYIGCKSLVNLEMKEKKYYYFLGAIFSIISLLVYIFVDIKLISIYLTLGLIFIYLILIYIISENKKYQFLLIILMLAEVYFNAHYIFHKNDFDYTKSLVGQYNQKKDIVDYVKSNDTSFYRMDFYNNKYNDALEFDYNSASGWLSTINSRVVKFMCKIGYSCTNNLYTYSSFITLDSLLGIKYYFSDEEMAFYEKINTFPVSIYSGYMFGFQNKDAYLYKNPLALSLGYMVSDNVKNNLNCDQLYECQEQMMSQMIDEEADVFYPTKIERIDENNYILTVDNNLNFTLSSDLDFSKADDEYKYNVYINDELLTINDEKSSYNIMVNNNYSIGQKIKIRFEVVSGNISLKNLYVSYRNIENFANVYNKLANEQLNIISFTDDHIKANINALNDGVLFTTIPYEKGWNVYVDGEKTNIYSIYDTFLGFDLNKGEHEIEFRYKAPGLTRGVIISSISSILFIIYQIYEHKKNKNSSN